MARRGTQAMHAETLEVEVQADHLARLAKCRPSSALAELIWNGLDADAATVSVRFRRNALGGLESVAVTDDGHGIGGEGEDPSDLFRRLGGSWKHRARRTKAGRAVHGQAGEGRFRAFALGDTVTWSTQRVHDGNVAAFSINKSRDSRNFTRTQLASTTSGTGTTVLIENIRTTPAPDAEGVFKALCHEFALYLRQYPGISIRFDDQVIDPGSLIARVDEIELDVDIGGDENARGTLAIVEWTNPMERALYLCDEDGFALAEVPAGIQAPGFNFTAHAKARYLRGLKEQNLIDSDLAPGRERVIDAVKRALRDHFRKRAAELAHGA
ncbi:MAG: ATP-binding protein, partial [Proteobacteria bacterium]|nr:ATP-binding protein [Pseudomonadota bacterium]